MIKRAITGWNAAPGAPANWNPKTDGDCGALPIRTYPHDAIKDGRLDTARLKYVESAWQPTPRELEMLNAGGSVILRVVGWQVPVALYVMPENIDEEMPSNA